MISSRLLYTTIMLFWIGFLSLMALMLAYAPQGGVELAGLTLFAGSGLVNAAVAAMETVGLSPFAQSVVFGSMAGLNIAAAGLALFALLFSVLGQAPEQREARPLAEAAAACIAVAAGLVLTVSLAGGEAGALLELQLAALGGVLLTAMPLAPAETATGGAEDDGVLLLDALIADHAASHAAYSAQLAALSRRGSSS